jgi:hypothetical protein
MGTVNNPSLRFTPRHEPGEVIPTKQETSIIDWLEASGRMMPRDTEEEELIEAEEDLDLIADNNYGEDDTEEEEEYDG